MLLKIFQFILFYFKKMYFEAKFRLKLCRDSKWSTSTQYQPDWLTCEYLQIMNGSIAANYPLDGATLIIILLILFDSYPLFPLSFLFKYVKTTVATVAYAFA